MQKMFFLTFFFGLFTTLFGQNEPLFTDGKSFMGDFTKIPLSYQTQKIIATKEAIFHICSQNIIYSVSTMVYIYTPQTLSRIKEVTLDLKYENNECTFQDVILSNEKIYIFFSYRDKNTKSQYLLMQTLNQKTFELNPDLQKVCEIPNSKIGNFHFIASQDKTKQLIYTEIPKKRAENEAFSLTVLDADMQPLWNREVELPYEEKLFLLENYNIDNFGNVYLVGILFNEKIKDKVKGKPNYTYKIFKFSTKESKPKEFDITLTDKFVNQLTIYVENDTIICAGLFGNRNTYAVAGIFYTAFDANTKSRIKESYQEFEAANFYEGASERKIKKAQKQLDDQKDLFNDFYFKNKIIAKNGNILLIGEIYYTVFTSTNNANITNTNYKYDDILVINISKTGNIEWSKRIPKHQLSTSNIECSYAFFFSQDKLYLAFNDHIKNVSNPAQALYSTFWGKNAAVSVVSLDENGRMERKILYLPQETGCYLLPKFSNTTQTSNTIQSKDWLLINLKRTSGFSKTQTNLQRITFP